MMNISKGYYFCLDDIASQIWEFLGESGQTFEEICSHFVEIYDVDLETCKIDTLAFLNTMKDEGLIEIGA